MSDEIKLKPCPFCGREAEFTSGYYNDLLFAEVHCLDCLASTYADSDRYDDTSIEDLEKMVVEDWNRRAQ